MPRRRRIRSLPVSSSQISDPTLPQSVSIMTLSNVVERWRNWKERRALSSYRQQLERKARKPRPTLPSTRSSLTLPNTDTDPQAGDVVPNPSSSLFTKLTFDTRLEIYRAVLGNQRFHIVQKGARLAFLFCTAKDAVSHTKYGCWGYQNLDGTFDTRYWDSRTPPWEPHWYDGNERVLYHTDGDILPLLLTCRRM